MSYASLYSNGFQELSEELFDDEEEVSKPFNPYAFVERLCMRPDIFATDRNMLFLKSETCCIILSVILGIVLNNVKGMTTDIGPDFMGHFPTLANNSNNSPVTILPGAIERNNIKEPPEVQKPPKMTVKRSLNRKYSGAGGVSGGGGDYRSRIMKTGILQCMNNGMISSLLSSTGDICAKGGYSDKIDAILSGAGGLKAGGASSAGRRGAAGIGVGNGYGSGYGGGSAQESVNDLLNNLMEPGSNALVLKKPGGRIELNLSNPSVLHPLIGGRSRASIMLVVQQNLQALRYAYNKRLQEKPGLKGKIMIRFAIDEFGKVIFCDIVSSSLPDRSLEHTVVSQIRTWVFDKIDKPGDVTEVEYPFVFSL